MRHFTAVVALALTLTSAAAQTAGAQQGPNTVVATVNGETVTLGQMQVMTEGLGEQTAAIPNAALWDMLLDQLTRQTAMAQAGESAKTPADVARIELARRALLARAALDQIAKPDPSEAELQAAYGKAFGSAEPATEYNAAHILVETEEAAKAVQADLAAGKDFGEVAAQRSTDASGSNKGDLGWFTLDMMVQPFADAVAKLEKGAVSEPVQSQFGWHIIKLNDSRIKDAPKLEEVREELAAQVRRERVEAELLRVVEAAEIDKVEGLSPDLLGRPEAPAAVAPSDTPTTAPADIPSADTPPADASGAGAAAAPVEVVPAPETEAPAAPSE